MYSEEVIRECNLDILEENQYDGIKLTGDIILQQTYLPCIHTIPLSRRCALSNPSGEFLYIEL